MNEQPSSPTAAIDPEAPVLCAVEQEEHIPARYRDTPIGRLLQYHNLERGAAGLYVGRAAGWHVHGQPQTPAHA